MISLPWKLSTTAAILNRRQLTNNWCNLKTYSHRRFIMTEQAVDNLVEWLIVIPDQPGKLEKRMAVRPKHIEALKKGQLEGSWRMGGAYLEDVCLNQNEEPLRILGSAMIVKASSREEVLKKLKDDIYAQENIWDFEKVQIHPFKCAFRTAL